jgi:mRNA-degrading endonuclease RelE of RelBE toxin-antitoxin system
MTVRLRITDRYLKRESRLPERIRTKARAALAMFVDDPNRPGLNFERLAGRRGYSKPTVTTS